MPESAAQEVKYLSGSLRKKWLWESNEGLCP